jgi:hypothetical protein
LTASLLLQGCSSKPRQFAPTLSAVPADDAQFDVAYAECRQLLAEGKLNASGRLASGAVGAAAGATTIALGSAAASGAGLYGGMAVAGATLVALPFVAIGGAWGMAKRKQKRKERAIQTATAGCLEERGYKVAGWARAHRKDETTSK